MEIFVMMEKHLAFADGFEVGKQVQPGNPPRRMCGDVGRYLVHKGFHLGMGFPGQFVPDISIKYAIRFVNFIDIYKNFSSPLLK